VVAVPEIPGITTGSTGSLSWAKDCAGAHRKTQTPKRSGSRGGFMSAFYPIGQWWAGDLWEWKNFSASCHRNDVRDILRDHTTGIKPQDGIALGEISLRRFVIAAIKSDYGNSRITT
jgi:hypothetical protein